MKSLLVSTLRTLCLLTLVFSLPLFAQKGGGHTGGGGTGSPPAGGTGARAGVPGNVSSGYGIPGYSPNGVSDPWLASVATCNDTWACPLSTPRMPATPTNDDSTCFLSPVAGIHSPTVSLTRLAVPQKAKEEHEKACSALKHKKMSDAEKHLLKAVKVYPDYAGAWVLLGQVQELEQKTNDATQSCGHAQEIDSSYAPAYLCLAYLEAVGKKWPQLKQLTDALLQLHPINASNAYYYNALAYLELNNLSAAETSALRGVADTKEHHQAHLHLLLAQIYDKEGDRRSEIAELHEYLKRDPHGNDVANVNNVLKEIEASATTAQR